MRNDSEQFKKDIDSLHSLPLSIMPIKSDGLRQARLVKNARLEGVVELYSEDGIGSAQIAPHQLDQVFDFGDGRHTDLDLVKNLSVLPSYDVFSMGLSLKRLGIELEEGAAMSLSERTTQQLAPYLRPYTQPLLRAVFQDREKEKILYSDLIKMCADPDVNTTLQNLSNISKSLEIPVQSIPKFLEDYFDTFSSLAYYRSVIDRLMPVLERFEQTVDRIANDPRFKSDVYASSLCAMSKKKLVESARQVRALLALFAQKTEQLWRRLSVESFTTLRKFIQGYQTSLGGVLCGLSVKADLWSNAFPIGSDGNIRKQGDFILREMRPGLNRIPSLNIGPAMAA